MTKGLTTFYLLHKTYPVKSGETILFHAAAGGVGQIFGQWAKSLGCTVIGTVGSDEKVNIAKENGYDHVINYNKEDFAKKVLEITNGKGVPVVYDGVGKDTLDGSIECLAIKRNDGFIWKCIWTIVRYQCAKSYSTKRSLSCKTIYATIPFNKKRVR